MAILIKRYANRKLYNTETSRYITLKGIAKLLDEGESVQVVDKETGEDITQVALSQILVGNERAKENPSDTLITQILSRGGDALYGALKKSVDDANDGIEDFQDRVRQFVKQSESAGRGFTWDASQNGERRSPFASRGETSDDAVDHDGAQHTPLPAAPITSAPITSAPIRWSDHTRLRPRNLELGLAKQSLQIQRLVSEH